MKYLVFMIIAFGLLFVTSCQADTFASKKQELLDDVTDRMGLIQEGIKQARDGMNYFHNKVCKIGTPIAQWTKKIENFALEYKNATEKDQEAKLLEIVGWLNDWSVKKVKREFEID
jgi:hypothetical protein